MTCDVDSKASFRAELTTVYMGKCMISYVPSCQMMYCFPYKLLQKVVNVLQGLIENVICDFDALAKFSESEPYGLLNVNIRCFPHGTLS